MAESRSEWLAQRRRSSSISDVDLLNRASRASPAVGSRLSYEDYEVVWLAARPLEMAAAVAMLDELHPSLPAIPGDTNSYTLGALSSGLNVALACLPSGHYGTDDAALVARSLRRTFPRLRIALLVGIGGGLPDKTPDLRLGDVVVGEKIVQLDVRRDSASGVFRNNGAFSRPPHDLFTAVAKLRADCEGQGSNGLSDSVNDMMRRSPQMADYGRPASHLDVLFTSDYPHDATRPDCDGCSRSHAIARPTRWSYDPAIHYGVIASASQAISDSAHRAKLAEDFEALCVDTETAGVAEHLPCLIVRGICDYADSHKNERWQRYAAATAAAYAKSYLAVFASIILRDFLMEALAFPDIDYRYLDVTPAHRDTCTWYRDNSMYQAWQDPNEINRHLGLLWIAGKAGSGKSTLMKSIYEEKRRCAGPKDVVVAFFFHARGSELQRSVEGMYRSLLYQILSHYPGLGRELIQILRESRTGNQNLNLGQLRSLLTGAILQVDPSSRITLFVDAIDECDELPIHDVLADLEERGRLAAERGIQMFTCFSSRHHPHITLQQGLRMNLEWQYGHNQDLLRYVESHLSLGSAKIKTRIQHQLTEKADCVFLWAVVAVLILNKVYKIRGLQIVQERLANLPIDVHELYDDMLDDLLSRDNGGKARFRLCVQWLLFAQRPLRYHEYHFAVLSGVGARNQVLQWMDGNSVDDNHLRQFVQTSSMGLAEITGEFEGTVQFIHQSVVDYLLDGRGAQRLWQEPGLDLAARSHEQLKECCLQYMISAEARLEYCMNVIQTATMDDREDLIDEARARFPFILYAFRHMLHHADSASAAFPQIGFLGTMARRWFNFMDGLAEIFKWESEWSPPGSVLNPPTLSYRLAAANTAGLMASLPPKELTLAKRGGPAGYPISIAVAEGCDEAVAAILEVEASYALQPMSPSCPACDGSHSPACRMGSVNLPDINGDTPLASAVVRNQKTVVDLLLSADHLDVNAESQGETPLLTAIRLERAEIVEKFLRSPRIDVNARKGDDERSTPLIQAVLLNSAKMTELLLLTPAVDVNARTKMGKTALLIACERGAADIVSLLLQRRNVAVNVNDARGKTPLLSAAISSHTAIVKMLLEYPGINVDVQDNEGHTPYSWGTRFAHSSIKALFNAFRPGPGRSSKVWGIKDLID